MLKLQTPQNEPLGSLTNQRTCAMKLYVMQNEHGTIKLGRSGDPQARRKELQYQTRCKIVLVAVFEQSGHIEEWLHLQLKNFKVDTEWFTGSLDAREAIAFLLKARLAWHFEYNAAAEGEWLRTLRSARTIQYLQRRENRMLRNLKAVRDGFGRWKGKEVGHEMLDCRLATFFGFTLTDVGHNDWACGYCEEKQAWMPVPRYTRDMSAAEALWLPGAVRRAVTTPVDCCLAALCDRWGFDEAVLSPLCVW